LQLYPVGAAVHLQSKLLVALVLSSLARKMRAELAQLLVKYVESDVVECCRMRRR
jgi:hypothetical protein